MKRVFITFFVVLYSLYAQSQMKIQALVLNDKNEALPSALILVDGMDNVYVTDQNGEVEIPFIFSNSTNLTIKYLGYENKHILVSKEDAGSKITIELVPGSLVSEEILVQATRAKTETPVPHVNLERSEILIRNLGQDVPILLNYTPSVVTSSDAGAGIGYTNMRIRGTDLSRINVTINGVPLNDAESHGVFWVDLPDFASSVENIQIQRGVGSSTNGAGAFGATINLQTSGIEPKPYAEIAMGAGSFNTLKRTINLGSGLINDHFVFNARYSKITSDGFIDRASSDLESSYFSGSYVNKKTILKFIQFSGKERTYQAWNGIDPVILDTNRTYNPLGTYTDKNNSVQYYENQVDDYMQNHFQFVLSQEISSNININATLHYTKGSGYYEEFMENDYLPKYQISPDIYGSDTIYNSDLVRRKWLDNDFYGATFSMNYHNQKFDISIGTAWNKYEGDHFGNIVWAQSLGNAGFNHEWYRGTGLKSDYNAFAKVYFKPLKFVSLYIDGQYRKIDYSIGGIDDDFREISGNYNFDFFNPKMGFFIKLDNHLEFYGSNCIANREPTRSNYVDAVAGKTPKHETLYDTEIGASYKIGNLNMALNFYDMTYLNQLVMTGEINDVGSPIMVNVPKSNRRGIEFSLHVNFNKYIDYIANITFSKNKIYDFTQYIDDWDNGGQRKETFSHSDLAYSPNLIMGEQIVIRPIKDFYITLMSKYVGKQYLDNTSNSGRSLDAYFVNDLQFRYSLKIFKLTRIDFSFQINNLTDTEYESNGWVYSYFYEGRSMNMIGMYPQAGRNYLFGINVKI